MMKVVTNILWRKFNENILLALMNYMLIFIQVSYSFLMLISLTNILYF